MQAARSSPPRGPELIRPLADIARRRDDRLHLSTLSSRYGAIRLTK
jgi:hypothetical protein